MVLTRLKNIITFLQEVWAELKKVTWPKKREVIDSTTVVIITTMIVIVFLWLVDMGLHKLMRVFLR